MAKKVLINFLRKNRKGHQNKYHSSPRQYRRAQQTTQERATRFVGFVMLCLFTHDLTHVLFAFVLVVVFGKIAQ